MPNDLPMLEWAGTSYAMANAHPSVLDARRPRRAPPTTRTAWPPCSAELFELALARVADHDPSRPALPPHCCWHAWAWCIVVDAPAFAAAPASRAALEQQAGKRRRRLHRHGRLRGDRGQRPHLRRSPPRGPTSVNPSAPRRSSRLGNAAACGLGEPQGRHDLPLPRHRHRGPLRGRHLWRHQHGQPHPGRQDREDPRRGDVGRTAASAGGHVHPGRGVRAAGFARMAAPGAAVALIGLLGLVVVRRLARRA